MPGMDVPAMLRSNPGKTTVRRSARGGARAHAVMAQASPGRDHPPRPASPTPLALPLPPHSGLDPTPPPCCCLHPNRRVPADMVMSLMKGKHLITYDQIENPFVK
jgi:hypothetical protein